MYLENIVFSVIFRYRTINMSTRTGFHFYYSKLEQYFSVELGGMVIPEVPLSQSTNLAVGLKKGMFVCTYAYTYRHIYTYMCMYMYA